MQAIPETHKQGWVSIENELIIHEMQDNGDLRDCDFGIQVAEDGRVWVCINGVAWVRFRPFPERHQPQNEKS